MTYSGLCSQLLLVSQLAPTTRYRWGDDVLISLIAILLTLSPPARSTYEVGALLGAKMLWERTDGADVEPGKAICSFVLDHPRDALADSDRGNLLQAARVGNFLCDCGHTTWTSILSPKKKKKKKTSTKQNCRKR